MISTGLAVVIESLRRLGVLAVPPKTVHEPILVTS
jgi:hypothetical protein